MLVGYRRSSTTDQIAGFDAQEAQLLATGCTKLFSEMVSSVADRSQLKAALDFVRSDDTLVVTRLDRLARSTVDLLELVAKLEAKGVALRILDFGGGEVDTKSATGKMLLTVLGAVAECERSLMWSASALALPVPKRKAATLVVLQRRGRNRPRYAS